MHIKTLHINKKKPFTALFVLLFGFILSSYSQIPIRLSRVDSAGFMVYLSANFSYNFILKSSDLYQESGDLMGIGTNISMKTASNWTLESGFNYYFAGKVKGIDSLFSMIRNSSGLIIDGNGVPADIEVDTRAWSLRVEGGKIFPLNQTARNGGLHLKVGIGVLQRFVFIKNPDNLVLQLSEEYKKGYDRLTLGLTLYQYIGYTRLSYNKYACFYGGLEFYEIFSKRQRAYDFNLMGKDNRTFFDAIIALKFGWIIPLYKKDNVNTYYFR